ncbi:MAG: hypothetical protein HN368_08965 [Spirochaetales bacterium]|jgi:hypothetical protein|nr:hypothetical protein [Spirochaetales bacterium]
MLSGKENLRRTIEFASPAYLPCAFDLNIDWIQENDPKKLERIHELRSRAPSDVLGGLGGTLNKTAAETANGIVQWVDEWGTGWTDDGHGAKTDKYPLQDGYTRSTVWFTLFERMWMLRGFDNLLIDPYIDEINFFRLQKMVLDYNLAIIDQWITRGVNVQGTMVRGTPEDVKREIHHLVKVLGCFDGGYIGGTSHSIMPETPLDNIIAMYEAFDEYTLH